MLHFESAHYDAPELIAKATEPILIGDHMNGFDKHRRNCILDQLSACDFGHEVWINYSVTRELKQNYANLDLRQEPLPWIQQHFFAQYDQHPDLTFDNFVCSFNGNPHVSRKLLTAILQRWRWFNPDTCSKNFVMTQSAVDGHLQDYLSPDQHRRYIKLFAGPDSSTFNSSVFSFGHLRFDHDQNINRLEQQVTSSWLHLVSESLATSYVPFITEKFLYSIVTRGLFLAYAQPGWHQYLETYYGFRPYKKLFDYRFDQIENPVERLIELMSMIAKYSFLSRDEWRDLYEMEADTIEYNYDWYFSKKYISHHVATIDVQNHEKYPVSPGS